ncbi:MAG: choice-of-anchor K domain-containing protein [Gammaproteobacteria bacterium]|nr:choice-of-anchor K domain-containing protein [Gammaproteobacteria bacterium]
MNNSVSPFRPLKLLVFMSCMLALFSSAHASSISYTLFVGSAYGGFSNPDHGRWDYVDIKNADSGFATDAASVFNWGCSRLNCQRGGHSSLAFDGVGSDSGETGFEASVGTLFSLGSLSYSNMPTYRSRHVDGVDFNLGLSIYGVNYEFGYMFDIVNTPNNGEDPDDQISLLSLSDAQAFEPYIFKFEGIKYELEVVGLSIDGGNSYATSLSLAETSSVSTEVYARINNVAPVPVPAAAWLFVSGMIGLLAVVRKRR